MDEFKAGDVVYLKSGSPKMVVEGVAEGGTWVKVVYSSYESNEIRRDSFLPITLILHRRELGEPKRTSEEPRAD